MTGPQNPNPDESGTERTYSAAELRDARRKARKLGLNPKNGLEAAKMLVQQGVEFGASSDQGQQPQAAPSQKAQATNGEKAFPMVPSGMGNLPMQSGAKDSNLPAVQSREERQNEIDKLQSKIVNKRSRRLKMMFLRFFGFILLPTFLFGLYQVKIATPLYATNSEMKIATAVGSGGAGQEAMFDLSAIVGDVDSIGLQNYLESGVVFEKLEQDFDLPALFMGDEIDRFSKVEADASQQDRYKAYLKYVKSTYDTTERLLKLEVKTPNPEAGQTISNLLISYAESQMDEQSDRTKANQVDSAEQALMKEQLALEELKREKLALQHDLEESPNAIGTSTALQSELTQRQAELREAEAIVRQMRENPNPNQIRLNAALDQVNLIELMIDDIMAGFDRTGTSGRSTLELETDLLVLDTEISAKVATVEAQRTAYTAAKADFENQKKFLETLLPPDTSFVPVYPKKVFSILAVFFILFSTYLFIGMTIDVIREQMSA